jgi:hypothetical protein
MRWLALAPILSHRASNDALKNGFNLADGVRIGPAPEWIDEEVVASSLSWFQRDRMRQECDLALTYPYDTNSIGETQARAEHTITIANLALWIARPTPVCFEAIFHFEGEALPTAPRQLTTVTRLVVSSQQQSNRLTVGDLEAARAFQAAIARLPKGGLLVTATRLLWKALVESHWETRYVLLWVVLEALFGPEDGREITFRLAQRLAFFLSNDAHEQRNIFETTKDAYGWRSKVVHGAKLKKLSSEKSGELTHAVEESIRKSIHILLMDAQLLQTFEGKQREDYLDSLPFRASTK